jgi:hypothetical protein
MKELIDLFYKKKYKTLYEYAIKYMNVKGRKYDASVLVSESYLFVSEYNFTKMNITEGDIEGLAKVFIKNQIRWETTPVNLKNCIKDNEDIEVVDLTNDYIIYDSEFITNIVNEFIETLNRYDRGIFNIYYTKNMTKWKDISSYLNISRASSFTILREAKLIESNLRDYVKSKCIE